MKTKSEIIKEEIELKKKELEQLEKEEKLELRHSVIKDLSEYTTQEKCDYFDKIYNRAELVLKLAEEESDEEDTDRDSWEKMMETLARDTESFWTYYNNIFEGDE